VPGVADDASRRGGGPPTALRAHPPTHAPTPSFERADLARQLLESLEEPDEVALDWKKEAESRLKAISSGEVETVSSDEGTRGTSPFSPVMRIKFHPAARSELSEVAQYYQRESPGIGKSLIK
jgi:hypothetical protein